MVSIKKILCPTDFSEPSYVALEAANGLALQYSSELCLVNIVSPITVIVPVKPVQMPQFDISGYQKGLVSIAEKFLQEVVEKRIAKTLITIPILEYL